MSQADGQVGGFGGKPPTEEDRHADGKDASGVRRGVATVCTKLHGARGAGQATPCIH
jgi:hypothetical protein